MRVLLFTCVQRGFKVWVKSQQLTKSKPHQKKLKTKILPSENFSREMSCIKFSDNWNTRTNRNSLTFLFLFSLPSAGKISRESQKRFCGKSPQESSSTEKKKLKHAKQNISHKTSSNINNENSKILNFLLSGEIKAKFASSKTYISNSSSRTRFSEKWATSRTR